MASRDGSRLLLVFLRDGPLVDTSPKDIVDERLTAGNDTIYNMGGSGLGAAVSSDTARYSGEIARVSTWKVLSGPIVSASQTFLCCAPW